MATKKKNSDVQTLDAVDDGAMNDVDEIEGTDTGDNGGNADGNDENTGNTEAPQNPDEVSSDNGNDGENDGDDTTIVPMGDDDDGDVNPLDDDGDDGDEDDDTDYAENFKLRGTELSYPVRDVKAQDRIKELEAEVAELKSDLMQSGYAHNAIYRGQYLGSEVTSEQYTAISNGTFDDLYIGDYWTISGVNWRIAGFNYYYNTGSSYNFNTNHIVIVPDTILYTAVMNDSNTTAGGYVGSQMYTTNIAEARATIQSAFGSSHIATHEVYLTTAVTNGYPSSGAWSDEDVLLMNEQMVYGCPIRQQMSSGGTNYSLATVEKSQLPLFFFNPRYVNIRAAYWLRDITSASAFALVSSYGYAASANASGARGVRPAFCLIS